MYELGKPLTAYYNIRRIKVPFINFTTIWSSIIFDNIENFIYPAGIVVSLRIQPEFKNAMSVS